MPQAACRSILVATDLSGGADEALRAAGSLAAIWGGEIHLVHVPELLGAHVAAAPIVAGVYQAQNDRVERELDTQIRRTLPAGVEPATRHVAAGGIHDAILARAAAVSADLIVLGGHRQRGLDRVVGGTAERVAAASDAVCLVVNGPLSLPLRRVGVAVDLTDPVVEAVELSVRWADALGTPTAPAGGHRGPPQVEVVALHVGHTVDLHDDPALEQRGVAELHWLLADARRRAGGGDGVHSRAQVLPGADPARALGTFGEQLDLLVVSTRGNMGLKRLVLESTTAGLLRAAGCPVLVVPPSVRGKEEEAGADGAAEARPQPSLQAETGAPVRAAGMHSANGPGGAAGAAPLPAAGLDVGMAEGRAMPRAIRYHLVWLALLAAVVVLWVRGGELTWLTLPLLAILVLVLLGWSIFVRTRR